VNHTWPSSPNPTPYEIFSHPRDAKYNKALFYELVKIYHPDRHRTTTDSPISHAVRLERYRLVVAANEILSSPNKRRAYDLHGAGWDGNSTLQSLYQEADRSWRNEPGNASRNATWEDWERWHRERNGDKQPQTRVFMSNELFVVVLCSFVVLGSLTQARRANTATMNIVEMRDQKHAAISGDLKRRQDEKAPLNRHERVESFLRQRDSWNLVSSVNDTPASAAQGK
jgi:curved DNA-binding protein CbpA